MRLHELFRYSTNWRDTYWILTTFHDLIKRYFRKTELASIGLIPSPHLLDAQTLDFIVFVDLADYMAEQLDS